MPFPIARHCRQPLLGKIPAMRVYQELTFRGDPDSLGRLIQAIEDRLSDGWSRSHDLERETEQAIFGPMYCFSCTSRAARPASDLWLAADSKTKLYVSNVVPREHSSLTHDQYNQVLQEFHNRFARPAADLVGVQVELASPDFRIDDVLSASAVQALRGFSSLANRSVLHPLDRERWNRFLGMAHREQALLTSDMLQRWLVEEEKWPEDKAFDLTVEYEHARGLLKTYEAQQA